MIKRILILFFIAFALFSVSVNAAYNFEESSGVRETGESAGYYVPETPEFYIGSVLRTVFSVVGIFFMLLTIYAGIKWMTAQGNNSQIEAAKKTLSGAIVGLVIIIVAYGITYFVINTFYPVK